MHEPFRLPNKRILETAQGLNKGRRWLTPAVARDRSSRTLYPHAVLPYTLATWVHRQAQVSCADVQGRQLVGASNPGLRSDLRCCSRRRAPPVQLLLCADDSSFARESNADPSYPPSSTANEMDMETSPSAAIPCARRQPWTPGRRSADRARAGVTAASSCGRRLYHTSFPSSSTSGHQDPSQFRWQALSANDPAGQCEPPSPAYACSLRVSSHPLCRFRQHFAASSTTHPRGQPNEHGGALKITKPVAA